MTRTCALCASREAQMERLEREVLELRLALANSDATTAARRDLEAVNARLVEANTEIRNLKARIHGRKAS